MARTDRCIIVASGPSAAEFVPPPGVPIFAVKRAITWLARADYWFSLDSNDATTGLLQRRRPDVKYYCAVPASFYTPPGVFRLERVSAVKGAAATTRYGTPEWWLQRWGCVRGLSEDKSKIHSGNSAYGALGLAYHLGFRDVLLVGVDGTQEPRVEGGRPNNLSHLPLLFQSAIKQVRLQTISDLDGIPKATLEEWLAE